MEERAKSRKLLTDEELRERQLADPQVLQRIEEARARARAGRAALSKPVPGDRAVPGGSA